LNKSEQRHALAQAEFTFKQGRVADRGHEARQFRASRLNLVIAAIVYWNSTYITDAVAHMRLRPSGAGRAARPHLAADLGTHRLLRRLPLGSRRSYRRAAPTAQPGPWQDDRLIPVFRSRSPFALSI
jgi:Tn3 transposase DDE domain